jgi:transposase
MHPTAHHQDESTGGGARLYVALELSAQAWRLAYSVSMRAAVTQVVIPANDRVAWERAIGAAVATHALPPDVPVWSCYEAGRDAFWVHRWLGEAGVHNVVVDSASIEVNRRARQAKTDRLDAAHLLRLLIRSASGERGVWQVVQAPTAAVEDARHPGRALAMLQQERTRYRNRLTQLLATQHVTVPLDATFPAQLAAARTPTGTPLGTGLVTRLTVCYQLLAAVEAEIATLEAAQHATVRAAATEPAAWAQQLTRLRGMGDRFALVLATEVCARDLQNRRQVGALTGFTPVPYQSGASDRDQGISGTGLKAVRELAVEMAWLWVQWQPASPITQWFQRRFAHAGRRARRVGIVAVARRLVIALWRYARHGVVPEGAVFKTGVPTPA